MKKLLHTTEWTVFILVSVLIVSCHQNKDNEYFNGEIHYFEDIAPVTHVTLKQVHLYGANYGVISVYDTLMIFWNTKLPDRFFNIFNTRTGEEIGEFIHRGGGPDEVFSVSMIYNFFKENNDLKTLLFAHNEEKILKWNISRSVQQGKTVIDTVYLYKLKDKNGCAYNWVYRQSEDTLLIHVQSNGLFDTDLNSLESTLPYFQRRTLYSDSLLQNYYPFKKTAINTNANVNSEFFFTAHKTLKPDGSKIAQAMARLSQLIITDTNTGESIGYRMKSTPDFSFFESEMKFRKSYYKRIQADNDFIYAPYWGKELWGDNEYSNINMFHVFDWNGNLIHKLITDHPISEIWLDQVTNRLYSTNAATDEVFYIDLNELDFSTR